MIDKNYIVSLTVRNNDDKKIGHQDLIPYDIVELLRSLPNSKLGECFKPVNSVRQLWQAELKCSICDSIYIQRCSKSQLLRNIKDSKLNTCGKCLNKLNKKQKEQHRIEEQNYASKIKENTTYYIDNYLDPDNSFKPNVSIYNKLNDITTPYIDNQMVSDYINTELTYSQFLQTPYWDAVSSYAKKRANFKCQLCNKGGKLNTHHKTYEHHGFEHCLSTGFKDLIVLCTDCHNKFHEELED